LAYFDAVALISKRSCFASTPQAKPPILPDAGSTLWHGMKEKRWIYLFQHFNAKIAPEVVALINNNNRIK
jgi:hypothetical protein